MLDNISFIDFFLFVVSLPRIPTSPSWGPLPSKFPGLKLLSQVLLLEELQIVVNSSESLEPISMHTQQYIRFVVDLRQSMLT